MLLASAKERNDTGKNTYINLMVHVLYEIVTMDISTLALKII